MKTMVLVAIAIAVALIFLTVLKRKSGKGLPDVWPYKMKRVLSEPEQTLYYRLKEALPECEVLAQVGLSRIIEGPKGDAGMMWFRKISQKTADFTICLRDFSVVAIIELDESSHGSKGRKKADADKDKAITDAGIPIIRWNVKNIPSAEEIRKAIAGTHKTPGIEK